MSLIKKVKKRVLVGKFIGYFLLIVLGMAAIACIRWKIHLKTGEYSTYVFNEADAFSLETFKNTNLYVDKNKNKLKVMQIADPQIKFGFITSDKKTMSLLDKALKEEKPDICVCTGDLTLSIFTYDAYKYFADFMENRHQYWTITYGNHDSQFDCNKYTLFRLLSNYKYCLFSPGPSNIKGESNFLVNIYKGTSAKIPSYSLVLLDSNMYPEGSDGISSWMYDWIGEDQISWYEWAMNGLKSINSNIKTSLFFHIPIKEFSDMYYAHELAIGHKIPEEINKATLKEVTNYVGYIREKDKSINELADKGHCIGIYYQGKNTGIFKKVKELGVTSAIICGHDHINTMKGYYDGILLSYGKCCGYHTYPYFDSSNLFTHLFGLDKNINFNGDLYVDDSGKKIEKGYTYYSINLSTPDFGKITITEHGAS